MKEVRTTTELANSSDGPAAPSEVQVIPFGSHETDRGIFSLDAQGMEDIIGDFQSRANDMVIDYEHQSLGEGEAPAAGWIKKLFAVIPASEARRESFFKNDSGQAGMTNRIKKAGIWAAVEWTPRAIAYLKNREYRYLSPVFMKRTDDNRVVRLLGAALTNTPAIDGMVPVVNKGSMTSDIERKEGKVMTKLLSALGLTAGATEEEALKSLASLKNNSSDVVSNEILAALGLDENATVSEAVGAVLAMKQAHNKLAELADLKAQISNLKSEMARSEAEGLVAQAMSEGKITPAQKEWATSYAERDPEGFKVFVARTPVLVPTCKMHSLGTETAYGQGDWLQISVNKLLMVSDEAFNKFSKKEE